MDLFQISPLLLSLLTVTNINYHLNLVKRNSPAILRNYHFGAKWMKLPPQILSFEFNKRFMNWSICSLIEETHEIWLLLKISVKDTQLRIHGVLMKNSAIHMRKSITGKIVFEKKLGRFHVRLRVATCLSLSVEIIFKTWTLGGKSWWSSVWICALLCKEITVQVTHHSMIQERKLRSRIVNSCKWRSGQLVEMWKKRIHRIDVHSSLIIEFLLVIGYFHFAWTYGWWQCSHDKPTGLIKQYFYKSKTYIVSEATNEMKLTNTEYARTLDGFKEKPTLSSETFLQLINRWDVN